MIVDDYRYAFMYCGNPELFSTSVYRSVTRIKTRLRKSIEKCWQFYNSIEKLGKMVTVPHLYVKLWKKVTILHVNKNDGKMMKVLQVVWKMHEKGYKFITCVWKIIKRTSSTWLWIIEKCYHFSFSLKNLDKDVAARQIYGKLWEAIEK